MHLLSAQPAAPIEPIAIIGMGCRFPGASNPAQFWQLLRSGADIAQEIPATRWDINAYYDPDPSVPGKMYVRKGYFLDDVDQFDPQFFNLAPREAAAVDPQQRLLLEVSWETLEHANVAPATLANSQTGLFFSTFWDDYSAQRLYTADPTTIDRYSILSNQRSMVGGRLAHLLGIHGPNVLVDTACSAALTALHLACQSLRSGECELALAGGVYLLLAPEMTIGLCQMGALAADGRSKAFDRAADGFGQGEGCGMVLLKRLSAAQADGDSIWALIRGSAINHDGHSRTVTTPNGRAQEMLLRQAMRQAGITAQQVQYVEAHGTGTELGDPIEVFAIAEAYGAERQTPLAIGSVKSNIGHLNAAAGIAGLFKVVLALHHGEIPPTLHINQLNQRIPWQRLGITVPTTLTAWPDTATPRLAGVSAFGLSGSNAHVILEEAPFAQAQLADGQFNGPDRSYHLLPLSATTPAALCAQALRYYDYLAQQPTVAWADLCHTAATGRSHFAHRLALVAASTDDAAQQLATIVPAVHDAGRNQRPPKLAFLFTGQGSQYVAMGRELYATQPTFRAVLDRCDDLLRVVLGRSLLDLLYPATPPSHNDLLTSHPCGQAVNFAVECALADLWRAWGVQPSWVLGHSLGDFAAAYCAGVLSLEDGLRLVVERGRLMEEAVGSMVAVLATAAAVAPFITPFADVTIGVINGPASVVISGGHAHVAAATAALQAAGFKTRQLDIPVAAHSSLLDPVLARFEDAVRAVKLAPPTCTVVSSMSGQIVKHELTDPVYWRNHLRNTVRFAAGVATLQQQGCTIFLEVGPKPTLLGLIQAMPDQETRADLFLPSLREGQNDWQQMLTSLGALYTQGVAIDWRSFDKAYPRRSVTLPTYPFQRERYWVDPPAKTRDRVALRPLIDQQMWLPRQKQTIFEKVFSTATLPFLAEHDVYGEVVAPGASYLALVLSAADLLFDGAACLIEDLIFPKALVLLAGEARTVQVVVSAAKQPEEPAVFEIISFTPGEDVAPPLVHATGRLARTAHRAPPLALAAYRARCRTALDPAQLYAHLAETQIRLGPPFRWFAALTVGTDEGLARLQLPDSVTSVQGYPLYPTLIDACFQLVGAVLLHTDGATRQGETQLPFALETFTYYSPTNHRDLWCHAQRTSDHKWAINLFTATGQMVATVRGFQLRTVLPAAIHGERLHTDWLQTVQWQSAPLPAHEPALQPVCWLLFGHEDALTTVLAARLAEHSADVIVLTPDLGAALAWAPAAGKLRRARLDPTDPAAFQQVLTTVADCAGLVGVAYLWGTAVLPDTADIPAQALTWCSGLLHLVQAWAATTVDARLWIVTQGCQAIADEEASGAVGALAAAGALWGLGRTISQELPALTCTAIDLAGRAPAVDAEQLYEELRHGCPPHPEPLAGQVAYRGGQRYEARLQRWPASTVAPTLTLAGDVSYLITGGLGGLGLQTAQQLIDNGAHYLVLSGRRATLSAATEQLLAQWRAQGVAIAIVQANIADPDAARHLLHCCDRLAPLKGIIHAAGVIDDGVLGQQSVARLASVMAPKVAGMWHLHCLTADHALDFFICFSSIAALLGSPGQSNYAAANAFMDTLMVQRRRLGLAGSTVQWGPWADVGLAAKLQQRMRAQGMTMIAPAQGRAILQAVLTAQPVQVGVIPANVSPLGVIAASPPQPAHTAEASPPPLADVLRQAAPAARSQLLETYLRGEIAQVLGLPTPATIGKTEHFFQIGFDSLMAVELKNRLQNALGSSFRATLIFDHPTLADLLGYLEGHRADHQQAAPPLTKADRTQPLPLSFAQQRLWFNQTSNRANSYNIMAPFRLTGPLDLALLAHCLTTLLAHHEVLRTVFPTVAGTPIQVITAPQPVQLAPIDLQSLDAAAQTAAITALIEQEVLYIYDLAQAPLFHIVCAKLAPEDHFLLFAINHILIDAGSLAQILAELGQLYTAAVTGTPLALPTLAFQYADYAVWQRRTLTPALLESRVQYWVERLTRTASLFDLCHDKPRPARESFRGAALPFQISVAQTQQLQATQKVSGATLFNTILAAWAALLYRYGQGAELVVGAPFANHTHRELAGVIGHWASMLILPLRFDAASTLLALIQQVNQATQEAMANDVPIDQLVQALPAAHKRNNLPHQFLIRYMPGNITLDLSAAGVTVLALEHSAAMLRPDLALTVLEEKCADGLYLACEWAYKVELFEEASIVGMIADFRQLLATLIVDPSCALDQVPLANLALFRARTCS